MENIKPLDETTFKQIYTNEKLRNEVAFAHGVADSQGDVKYRKALCYPTAYKVTGKQIKEAQKVRNIKTLVKNALKDIEIMQEKLKAYDLIIQKDLKELEKTSKR